MDDTMIIELYQNRSESAIAETASKYGSYCLAIATNILKNREDAEECVNDTYYKVWEAIPPEQPASFSSFIGRITRNTSLNKYKSRKRNKRFGNEFSLLLSELEDCIPSSKKVEEEAENLFTSESISRFLYSIDKESRVIFMRRYYYADSVKQVAERLVMSESKVKSNLFRTRNKLKAHLESEGLL
ncbi:MAG: sigma-70 family RNA polymerase sigma factor [Oscillospiraceae bacterium]|jgi:RNA polymerase sigma-70 factor (ECF subfamily)|nr:sigma-70 family RNA polymerase sigma factor [Oscillospiraceae bacterium]